MPSEVKINAQFYVDYVLKPLFTEYLPKLYRNEMDKVFFHHDKFLIKKLSIKASNALKNRLLSELVFVNK